LRRVATLAPLTVLDQETVLLNPTVGMRRIVTRLLSDSERPLSHRASTARRRSVAFASSVHARLGGRGHDSSLASTGRHDAGAHPIRGAHAKLIRLGREAGRSWRLIPIAFQGILRGLLVRDRSHAVAVAALVLLASFLSFGASASTAAGSGGTGGTGSTGGPSNRFTIAGLDNVDNVDDGGVGGIDQAGPADVASGAEVDPATDPQGPFLDDGTLVMPVAVDTTVDDGSALLKSYKVKSGDTLTGIAHHFGVSMMSVWWANQLKTKDELHVGQTLVIPPVSGVVVTVATGDTLDSLAKKYSASADEIQSYNGLTESTLVIGQRLIIPDGLGKSIPTPKPTKAPVAASGGGGGAPIHPPSGTYSGGKLAWPVPGGYISQYFHYGHPALDIAAPYGTRILAGAAGTVIFAGWKDDMGGYQVWISHGSGLYTAYYHMSAILVNVGQHVGRAQQIGRVGQSGVATGPHCHFEVWKGYPWQGSSYRVNPLAYL
jgi:murein DD-endopeptidase MepM/ murein hydrolase activator NlpD